jgi:flagellar hook-basal body complex protein FliE
MALSVDGLSLRPPQLADGEPKAAGTAGGGFGARLAAALERADGLQKQAEAQAREVAAGKGDVVETMVTMAKADLALRLVVNVRNSAIEAYQEIMRTPL